MTETRYFWKRMTYTVIVDYRTDDLVHPVSFNKLKNLSMLNLCSLEMFFIDFPCKLRPLFLRRGRFLNIFSMFHLYKIEIDYDKSEDVSTHFAKPRSLNLKEKMFEFFFF